MTRCNVNFLWVEVMIAFRNNRPLLQTGHCVIGDYDQEWLETVLAEAAQSAGVALPFRADIARAVLLYLEDSCPLNAVPLEYLFERIRRLLCEVGLPRIAEHLRRQAPPVDIDLDALAREAPLPLFFYEELRRRLEELRRLGLDTYRFRGQRACSLMLGRRQRTCPTQRRELAELEGFLQRQL